MRDQITVFAILTLLQACGDNKKAHDGHSAEAKLPTSDAIDPIEEDSFFVVNGSGNSISIISAKTYDVTGTIRLKNIAFPHHININTTGEKAIIAVLGMDLSMGHGSTGKHTGHGMNLTISEGDETSSPALIVIETKTGKTLVAKSLAEMNHNGIFVNADSEIWTSAMTEAGMVHILNAESLEEIETIEVGKMPAELTLSEDGSKVFVANSGSDSVSVIDVEKRTVLATVPTGDEPVGAWPGGNGIMYIDNEKGKSLTALDAESLSVTATYELGFTPAMAATVPNGELWVTDTDNGKVVVFESGNSNFITEITVENGAHGIKFSSDGKLVAVSNQLSDTVSIIDAESRSVLETVSVGSKPNGIAFIEVE